MIRKSVGLLVLNVAIGQNLVIGNQKMNCIITLTICLQTYKQHHSIIFNIKGFSPLISRHAEVIRLAVSLFA